MISDLDIYRSAAVLIREHGKGAAVEAASRADAMLEKGDFDGQKVWKRILAAVQELQRMELPAIGEDQPHMENEGKFVQGYTDVTTTFSRSPTSRAGCSTIGRSGRRIDGASPWGSSA